MADFSEELIEIRYDTDLWPLVFSFPPASSTTANDGAIPYGETISAVTVRTFLGNVQSKNTLTDFTELSTLVDGSPSVVNNTQVSVTFQFPTGAEASNTNQKVTVVFELTLASGAKHPFYFQYLKIMGDE